jgi:hypothetical protein
MLIVYFVFFLHARYIKKANPPYRIIDPNINIIMADKGKFIINSPDFYFSLK